MKSSRMPKNLTKKSNLLYNVHENTIHFLNLTVASKLIELLINNVGQIGKQIPMCTSAGCRE